MKNLIDFETSQLETVSLEPNYINRALKLCSQIHNEEKQWQIYLNTLALFGLVQWLLDRDPEIPVNYELCSVFQPQSASKIDLVCNVRVGEFKLCLVVMGSLTVEDISMPITAINLPESRADFYVVVEVQEEQEQATIQGFIHYDQLLESLQSVNLQAAPDATYQLPWSWFERDVDLLLLYLRCLKPTTLGSVAATNSFRQDRIQLLAQPFLNVGLWLRDEIDEVAQGLSWVLLPALTGATAMRPLRSPTQELEVILIELQRIGTQIPPEARGAYQDLQLSQTRVRLYAVTWPLLSPGNVPEWTLLLVLGAPPGYNNLSFGTTIRVRDETRILVEQMLNRDSAYIYACVAGTWDETFIVTIALKNGTKLTLPPFAFRPDLSL